MDERKSCFTTIEAMLIRNACCCAAMLVLLSQSGCQMLDRFRGQPTVASPVAFNELPSKEQILAHLGTQSDRIRQLQSDVRVSMEGMPTLRGTLAVERPDKLRLNAGLLGVTELGVDVGSNEETFWFWTKVAAPGEEPGIYYAKHEEYRNSSLSRSIPIEPSWLIDALGLVSFEPDDRIEGPFHRPQDGRLELRTYRGSGNNMKLRITVIDPTYGWVNQQTMYDATGQMLAYADSIKYQHHPEHNVSLPSRIEITAINPAGAPLKISIDANSYRLNSIYGDPAKLWAMPNPGNVPLIDLVRAVSETQEIEIATGKGNDSRSYDHRTSNNKRNRSQFGARELR